MPLADPVFVLSDNVGGLDAIRRDPWSVALNPTLTVVALTTHLVNADLLFGRRTYEQRFEPDRYLP